MRLSDPTCVLGLIVERLIVLRAAGAPKKSLTTHGRTIHWVRNAPNSFGCRPAKVPTSTRAGSCQVQTSIDARDRPMCCGDAFGYLAAVSRSNPAA